MQVHRSFGSALGRAAKWLSGYIARYFRTEYIGLKEQTRGTETSKYPEERTSTDTPLVAASERGPAEPCE